MKPKSPSYYELKYGIEDLKKKVCDLEFTAAGEFKDAVKKLKEVHKILCKIKV